MLRLWVGGLSMFIRFIAVGVWAAAVLMSSPALADPQTTPEEQAETQRLVAIVKSEKPIFGDVAIPGANATLHLGKDYYFLGKDDARRAIVEGWKNPESETDGVIGMIIPAGKVFADSWGAIVTYDPSGYVTDKDADKANYDDLITQAHDAEANLNDERTKQGFPTIHLVGWAQPPSYNRSLHYLIWARDIKFGQGDVDTLNYDVRMLGRSGVLSVNVVAAMPDLPQVRTDADALARTIAFNPGARYGDFDSVHDKKAAYGVAGLVAAGMGLVLAQKFGLIAVVLLFLKKGIIIVVALFAGLARWFASLFGGKKKKAAAATLSQTSAPSTNFLVDEGSPRKPDDPIVK